eukprot:TRINITY_DN36922_c0_g1_i1.p1 TRINITY_DN36922_c0_g1~~TRINITY_DN36922_c0_g1_i1.p1  ORF type:complete len:439 (+),score=86.19 TRINITY_DN36922_c0_g1_i1:72-1388(+)
MLAADDDEQLVVPARGGLAGGVAAIAEATSAALKAAPTSASARREEAEAGHTAYYSLETPRQLVENPFGEGDEDGFIALESAAEEEVREQSSRLSSDVATAAASSIAAVSATGMAAFTGMKSSILARTAATPQVADESYQTLESGSEARRGSKPGAHDGFVALDDGAQGQAPMMSLESFCQLDCQEAPLAVGGDSVRDLRRSLARRLSWRGRILVVQITPERQLYIGPHWPCTLILLGMIFGIGYCFESGMAEALGSVHVFISTMITLATATCLLKCGLADPGILMPTCPDNSEAAEAEGARSRPKCNICKIRQPPGCRHCGYCGVCVEGFDHHCPWMSKCIGKKNLNAFHTFLCVGIGSLVYMFIATVTAPVDIMRSHPVEGLPQHQSSQSESQLESSKLVTTGSGVEALAGTTQSLYSGQHSDPAASGQDQVSMHE